MNLYLMRLEAATIASVLLSCSLIHFVEIKRVLTMNYSYQSMSCSFTKTLVLCSSVLLNRISTVGLH